jgi:signal transduction histidine kinase
MKLRAQLALLVGGIVVVPFLVALSVLMLQYLNARANARDPERMLPGTWIRAGTTRSQRVVELRGIEDQRPPGMEVVVLGADGTVEFSTIPGFVAGASIDSNAVLEYLRENDQATLYRPREPQAGAAVSGVAVGAAAGAAGAAADPLFLVRLPPPREEPVNFVRIVRSRVLESLVYPALGLLLFASGTSFWIVRRFNRSVRSLEAATRRVADGELDFSLPVRGNDEVASLTRSFDRMRSSLKEEFARRARFIMGVSHDLRTPLALIQGYVEAVADGKAADPETHRKYLSIVQDKTRALDGMVTDLIEFVRMDTGEWKLTHRPVALAPFLRPIAQRYAEDAAILSRSFTHAIDLADDVEVSMDEPLLGRALENLIGNAIRYTEEGGSIELRAFLENGAPVLTITDTGIGIPAEDLPRIFDPFYRGTNARREQGIGLGLATVKSIVEGHGWTIAVSSDIGKGSTFRITMGRPAA